MKTTANQKTVEKLPVLATANTMAVDGNTSGYGGLAYLAHFIKCYRPKMQIAAWNPASVYLLDDNGQKTSIAFINCKDSLAPLVNSREQELMLPYHFLAMNVKKFWIVFLTENIEKGKTDVSSLIKTHKLSYNFDKIFLFDFFQSTIHHIK